MRRSGSQGTAGLDIRFCLDVVFAPSAFAPTQRLARQRRRSRALACAAVVAGQPRERIGTITDDRGASRALLAAGLAFAMASMFFADADWSCSTALLAAGGVGALVSCACAMAEDDAAEDAAAAWGAEREATRAPAATGDGEKHLPAPTPAVAPARPVRSAAAPGAAPANTASSFWSAPPGVAPDAAPAAAPEAAAATVAAAPAAKQTARGFWRAPPEDASPAPETGEPVTFEQATGAARLDQARRCRAAEVTESERQFMREFTAMMAAGLVVVLQVKDSDGVAVNLSLQELRNEPVLEWRVAESEERGHLSLKDVVKVRGQNLLDALAKRSFVIEGADQTLVFHAETGDICALVIDGLEMLVTDHKRRSAKRRSSLGPARKARLLRTSPKKPLAAAN